jgi:soluble lytic murein transglycosylase-like protein
MRGGLVRWSAKVRVVSASVSPAARVRSSAFVDDVVVPAILVFEHGLEVGGPALRSPKVRAAVALPLVALALKMGVTGESPKSQGHHRPRPSWPYASVIATEARRNRLEPALVAAVIAQESNFNPHARNDVSGASGVMQLAPATARALGVTDPMSPRQSISAGCRYLRQLLDGFHGKLTLALAAYNAGPTAVAQAGRVPDLPETRRYVDAVTHRYARLRARFFA